MPMFFSMNHGGIAPCLSRREVRSFMARAHGRTSLYVMRDIGATELGWWQFWQLRCRIGAMSFEKVTSPGIVVVSAALAAEEPATEITAGTRKASPTLSRQQKI